MVHNYTINLIQLFCKETYIHRAPVNKWSMETQEQQHLQERRDVADGGDAPQLILIMVAKSFKGLIPMLVGVLQVNSQGKDESPFDSHRANMWVFVFSTIIYFPAAQVQAVHVAIISGSLSSVSAVSVLLPRLLGHLIFILWAFVTILLTYHVHAVLIHHACCRLHQTVMNIISKSKTIWTWFTQSGSSEHGQQRLPV